MSGRQMSCRQQIAPPPHDPAKMSPRISIGQKQSWLPCPVPACSCKQLAAMSCQRRLSSPWSKVIPGSPLGHLWIPDFGRHPWVPAEKKVTVGPRSVCVLLLQDLLQSCARGGRRRVKERRRAEACVDESAHHALVNAGGREIV